ncbi:MAG: hypothetical protein MK102_08575 [Fuerstiella sp.]|nr:hypothetical protein [Fuerstiella sp.]
MNESESTRRHFLKNAGAASSLTGAGLTTMAHVQGETAQSRDTHSCLDYRRSFICGTSESNSVRFWIESRTTITNTSTGKNSVFYQCASCKSENTFGKHDLFLVPNYDFLPILGDGHWLIFRRHAQMFPDRYRLSYKAADLWGEPRFLTHEAKQVGLLQTYEEIRDATAEGVPLISQTELVNTDADMKATIECPVKTMNISLKEQMYQVDTGPIAFPDLNRKSTPLIECLDLAFIAFNQDSFADFVIEQPTFANRDEEEPVRIYHYSNPISLEATNRILTHA